MYDSKLVDSAPQVSLATLDPKSLWTEPEFPSHLWHPYDMQLVGGEITRNAILRSLIPATDSAPVRNAKFIVLQLFQIRLYRSARRYRKTHDPKFGEYRYFWDTIKNLSNQTGIDQRSLRRTIGQLEQDQILHRITGTNGNPNHYRLTDAAFKMCHAFQFPFRHILTEAATVEAKGLALNGKNQATGKDWITLAMADRKTMKWHIAVFPKLIGDIAATEELQVWHKDLSGEGQKRMPEATPFWPEWQKVALIWLEGLRAEMQS